MEKSVNSVLLIDDDKATNFLNHYMLSRHKSFDAIHIESSGIKALNYLKKVCSGDAIKPNLIFLDINMPGMNGWEFLEKLSRFPTAFTADMKIIMLSASSSKRDINKSFEFKLVNDYMSKPLSINILDTVLASHF